MKNFRFFDSFRIEKLLTCMGAHRHGIQSRENSSKMADSFDFYVCGLPQPLKRSPGHPGALGMMAPILGLSVADTGESHTLGALSGGDAAGSLAAIWACLPVAACLGGTSFRSTAPDLPVL